MQRVPRGDEISFPERELGQKYYTLGDKPTSLPHGEELGW